MKSYVNYYHLTSDSSKGFYRINVILDNGSQVSLLINESLINYAKKHPSNKGVKKG